MSPSGAALITCSAAQEIWARMRGNRASTGMMPMTATSDKIDRGVAPAHTLEPCSFHGPRCIRSAAARHYI